MIKNLANLSSKRGFWGIIYHFFQSRVRLPLQRASEEWLRRSMLHSYSQYAEDLVIDHLLANQTHGSYVDIGANDPNHFNNTRRFYGKGWRGVNVEPNPMLFEKLARVRGGDINLNIGVGLAHGVMQFHIVAPHTLSTFSIEQLEQLKRQGYRLEKTLSIEIWSLSKVLQLHQQQFACPITLLSIDVEGFELEVLSSHDWKNIRPRYPLQNC